MFFYYVFFSFKPVFINKYFANCKAYIFLDGYFLEHFLLPSADGVKLRLSNAYIVVLNVCKGKLNKLSKLVLTMYVYGETRTTKLVKTQCYLKIYVFESF